jgi:hypothetical protein
MKKRGQITVFMIVGILILLIIALTLFFTRNIAEEEQDLELSESAPVETSAVKMFVESCLRKTGYDAIYYNYINGGFYQPQFITLYNQWSVPYYYHLGNNLIPVETQIEDGLKNYIENNILICLNDFEAINDFEVVIAESPIAKVNIKQNQVDFGLDLPLEISRGETTKGISKFSVQLEVPLKKVNNILSNIIEEQEQSSNEVMLDYLSRLAVKENFTTKMFYNVDEVIYILTFDQIDLLGRSLITQFVIKYDWYEIVNKSFDLKPIEKQSVVLGKELVYNLNYTGENVSFKSNHQRLKFNNGTLIFIPLAYDLGEQKILISATNDGDYDFEWLLIDVMDKQITNSDLINSEVADLE